MAHLGLRGTGSFTVPEDERALWDARLAYGHDLADRAQRGELTPEEIAYLEALDELDD